MVECTSDAHCQVGGNSDADASKAYCNLPGGTRDTANFPYNTCIDSVPPTSKMKKPTGNTIENDASVGPFFIYKPLTGGYSGYLGVTPNTGNPNKRWWIYVQDTDTGGAGVDTCYISINGGVASTRVCNGWVSFWVGSQTAVDPKADCSSVGDDACTIKVWSRDRAVNTDTTTRRLSPDLTIDERTYSTKDFNEFSFGVDWVPPTATAP